MRLGYVCSEILGYMVSRTNAKHLYEIIHKTNFPLFTEIKLALADMDYDGDCEFENEYCDKFVGLIKSDPKWFAAISAYAANMQIDVIKTHNGYESSLDWLI